MSHCDIYGVKRINVEDRYDSFTTDEDEMFNQIDIMDYATEYETKHLPGLVSKLCQYLRAICGEHNVSQTGDTSFILTRAGIEEYFSRMRSALQLAIEAPLEQFISNGTNGWWAIRDMIETPFGIYWKFEDSRALPTTSFLQDLYAEGQEQYELVLIQAFDYHF